MQHIFLPPEQFSGDTARILGVDHLHLARVLRARTGETVVLLDNAGNAFRAILVTIDKTETTARIEAPIALPPEPMVSITVAQALGKGDKFEQVIQHGTEVGAAAFIPVRAERSVADIPAAKLADRRARWNQIVKSAAEQCGRSRLPIVSAPQSLRALLQDLESETRVLLLHPAEDALPLRAALAREARPPAQVLIVIGPEGGWSPVEVAEARQAPGDGALVSLGPRVLRTETAALVAISQILYHFER